MYNIKQIDLSQEAKTLMILGYYGNAIQLVRMLDIPRIAAAMELLIIEYEKENKP